jgi:hypothetical protein
MITKFTNILHSKALQNLPKLLFLVWNNIWQPWTKPFLWFIYNLSILKRMKKWICHLLRIKAIQKGTSTIQIT